MAGIQDSLYIQSILTLNLVDKELLQTLAS